MKTRETTVVCTPYRQWIALGSQVAYIRNAEMRVGKVHRYTTEFSEQYAMMDNGDRVRVIELVKTDGCYSK